MMYGQKNNNNVPGTVRLQYIKHCNKEKREVVAEEEEED